HHQQRAARRQAQHQHRLRRPALRPLQDPRGPDQAPHGRQQHLLRPRFRPQPHPQTLPLISPPLRLSVPAPSIPAFLLSSPPPRPAPPRRNPPPGAMWKRGRGGWPAQPPAAVPSLGIADRLKSGPRPVQELAAATGTNEDALYRALRGLASLGVFAEGPARNF